jgi:hypothetical protein
MVQAPLVKVRAQVVVWAEARDKAEAGWADRLPPVRAEIVYVRPAVRQSLMLPDSLAIKEVVQNVGQK